MGRAPKYHDDIERLLSYGYNAKDVSEELNIGIATVYRVLAKLKKQARYDFKNLMSEDYLWKYQKTLENFDKTIRQCNEEITAMKKRYIELEAKINLEITSLNDKKAITKATLLQSLINIQSNRSNELAKLTAQRDKASDMKAKVYNAGPVVNAIDQWINQTTPTNGELPKVDELDKLIDKPQPLPSPNINEPDDGSPPSWLNSDESNNIEEESEKDE